MTTLDNKNIYACARTPSHQYKLFPVLFPKENLTKIPSVVIEPASNHEGDGNDHDTAVNESTHATEDVGNQGPEGLAGGLSEVESEPKTLEEVQTTSSEEQPVSADHDMPPGFLYKVYLFHFSLILILTFLLDGSPKSTKLSSCLYTTFKP